MTVLEGFRAQNVERIQSTGLVQSIIEGRPERHHYIGYLVNVYNYAQHSPTVIALAASRCVQTHPKLGRYLVPMRKRKSGTSTGPCPTSRVSDCRKTESSGFGPHSLCDASIGIWVSRREPRPLWRCMSEEAAGRVPVGEWTMYVGLQKSDASVTGYGIDRQSPHSNLLA
jgi:hypothetical protein